MNQPVSARSGGHILVNALAIHGVDLVFSVPGESFLPAIDGLYAQREKINLVSCRQEGAAAHMAEAYGKLTGKPGVCFVTRGPGATNASIAVHTAMQDSTPMVLLVGQVSRKASKRETWQEIDLEKVFGSMAKWAVQVEDTRRIPEIISRAFHTAVAGRPGPVVVGLPEDMLYEEAAVADVGAYKRVQAHPGPADLQAMVAMLAQAERPLVVLGGGGWSKDACDGVRAFVEAFKLPVGTSFRRQDLLDNRHPNFVGDIGIGINPALAKRVRESDLLIAIGTRLGETTTSDFSLIAVPHPAQKLVHVHADPEELGRVYQADLPINAGMLEFAQAAAALPAPKQPAWAAWTEAARADYLDYLKHGTMPGELDMGAVMALLRDKLPADAIVTNGAGNYASWVHRFYQYRGFRTQLAPTSGVMGYGVPAACAAKLVHPERIVVCFAGDGCFQMNAQELATVKQYGLKIIFIVVNNGMWGSIRMHQEMHYPGRVHGTSLENPDFVALAKAYGLQGETVLRTDDFMPAFERALQAGSSTLLELRIDPEAITPRTTLAALRAQALAKH
ncbi:MAG TPA: thiamine pyrophosphate-binding protein [Noviherbaspirillum sp.]